MKKKLILFMLISIVMMCLLAISVSATVINKDTTVTLNGSFTMDEGSVANPVVKLYDAEGYALVWYLNTDNKLVSDRAVNLITVTDNKAKFSDVSKFYGGSQQKGVVVVNLRDDFVKDGVSGIQKFDTSFQFGYYGANRNVPIQYFYFPKTATEIIDRMFQNTQLIIADIEPGTPITYMGIHAVTQSNLKEFFVPKGLPNFIEHDDIGVFQDTQLEKITFEEGSQIKVIPYRCFYMCKNLKELILPNSVEEIHYRALQFSMFGTEGKLEKLVLGANFKGFKGVTGDNFYVRGAANVKVYLPATFSADNVDVSSAHQYFTLCPNATFYYCGTEAQWDALITEISKGKNGATGTDSGENIITAKANGKVVFNVDPCDTFYNGTHDYKGTGDCKDGVKCDRCADTIAGKASHTEYETLVYVSFASNGVYNYGCSNEGCTKYDIVDKTMDPLFTAKGYSVGPDGYSLKAGFTVNTDALVKYKELHPDFTFGMIMVNAGSVSADASLFVNGSINSTAKGLQISIDNIKYTSWNADVAGFNASVADSLELVVGIYTNDGEGNVSVIQYVDADKYATTKTYADMSLNAITFNQVRVGHGMEALVPQPAPAPTGDEQ